jgi:hypothetical protein
MLQIYTGCVALNADEIKHYISSTIKCIGQVNIFSNSDFYNPPVVKSREQGGQGMGHHLPIQ